MEGGDTEQRGHLRAEPRADPPHDGHLCPRLQPAHRKTWRLAFLPSSSGLIRQANDHARHWEDPPRSSEQARPAL